MADVSCGLAKNAIISERSDDATPHLLPSGSEVNDPKEFPWYFLTKLIQLTSVNKLLEFKDRFNQISKKRWQHEPHLRWKSYCQVCRLVKYPVM